jgi:hypothetical protein
LFFDLLGEGLLGFGVSSRFVSLGFGVSFRFVSLGFGVSFRFVSLGFGVSFCFVSLGFGVSFRFAVAWFWRVVLFCFAVVSMSFCGFFVRFPPKCLEILSLEFFNMIVKGMV